uniref:Uncharacterized protein n=1 Tax=Denticeps clupeoides TaxID=299321 RepID=A0AAY4BVR9_9TELE
MTMKKYFTIISTFIKQNQAVVGFLEANRILFEEVDITMLEDQRLWMYRNIPEEKHPGKGNPLPPQIFNGDEYLGVRISFMSPDAVTETVCQSSFLHARLAWLPNVSSVAVAR